MSKKRLLTASAALLTLSGAYAQYFGVNFYKEGFDTEADLAKWTVNTTLAPSKSETQLWVLQDSGFDEVDASSKKSVAVILPEGERVITSLVSPVIDTTGKKGLFAGLFGKDAFRNNYNWVGVHVYFEVQIDGTDEWETLYESPQDANLTDSWDWQEVHKQLDSKYDGKKIRLRIRLRSDDPDGCGMAKTVMFDGAYLSENYGREAMLTAISPDVNDVFLSPTPISVTVKNNGSEPMTSYKVAYSINGAEEVQQDVNATLQPGEETTVSFTRLADFTEPGMEYEINARVILPGDMVEDNDAMDVSVHNILASLPYTHTITNRNDTDFWYTPCNGDDKEKGAFYLHRDLYWIQQTYGSICNWGRLYSRPVSISKGQSVSASFTAWSEGYDGEDPLLEVYYIKYADRDDISKATLLKSYDLTTSKMSDKVSFIAPEEGVYSIMFYNKSEVAGKNSAINGFSISITPDYEAAIVKFTAPKFNKDEFTDAETVTIQVSNNGLKPMSGAKVRLMLDGNAVATEDLPAIAAGEVKDFTFATKVNMLSGSKHTMTAELLWDLDSDASNNKVSGTFVADLASPPYSIDSYSNDFQTHWEWTDNNNDGHTFEFEEVYGNTRVAYNPKNETVPTTDETMYARTLRLESGKTYKASGRLSIWAVDGVEQTFDAEFDLYKVAADGTRTLCKNIAPKAAYSSEDGNYVIGFDVPETGKYSIAYHITKDSETKTKLVIAGLTVEESGDVEAILSSVTLPGTTLTGYNKLPFSVRISNNGLKPLASVKLKVATETEELLAEDLTFDTPLAPGASANIAVPTPIELNITSNALVTFTIEAPGDVVPSNNTKTEEFKYLPPKEIPVNVAADGALGWLSFDCDGDGSSPYFYSWYESYDFSSGSYGDRLMSPSFNIVKDTPYRITYSAFLNYFSETGKMLDLYLLNVEDSSKTPCSVLVYDMDNTPGGYSSFEVEAYAQVDKDGTYVLVYEHQCTLEDSYPTFRVGGPLKIEAVDALPDMKMTAITSPVEDAVFAENETVTATYTNAGNFAVNGMMFSLQAGDKTYYAYVNGEIAPAAEGTVTFNNVNLSEPGEYTLTASVLPGADANPADNSVALSLMSKFIYNVNVLSIDGPDNGALGAHEHVVVSIKNEGHGTLTDTPVSMTITDNIGSEPVTVTEVIEEPIAEGQTLQYTFKAESDFSRDATYTVSVIVKLEGDITPDNDTHTANIVSTHEDMDAGVTAIVGPDNRRMTETENIVVKVKNFSAIDIYRVPVTATVFLGEEEVATVSGIIPEIAADSEVEYTIPEPVNMLHGGTYTVKASTKMANDVDASNDACEGSLYAFIKDCGVSRIVSPEGSAVEGKLTITVEITNFGDVPMSNIPVLFKLGNNPQADTYEGELAPGESVEFSFKSAYNFKAGKEYTLTAYTAHPEDENPDNDAFVAEIKPTSGIAGVYADGAVAIHSRSGAIVVTTEEADGMVEVYDASGMVVCKHTITDNETVIPAAKGIYIVRVATAYNTATAKVNVR